MSHRPLKKTSLTVMMLVFSISMHKKNNEGFTWVLKFRKICLLNNILSNIATDQKYFPKSFNSICRAR